VDILADSREHGGMPGISMETVADLKRRMVMERDLSVVMEFFFDNFWDNPEFLKMGKDIEMPKELRDALTHGVAQMFQGKKGAHVLKLVAVDLPGTGLIHGSIQVDTDQGLYIWATDLNVTVFSVGNIFTGQTNMGRITVTPAAASKKAN
jgi:hypothetical protein